jgi:hypothetical protein
LTDLLCVSSLHMRNPKNYDHCALLTTFSGIPTGIGGLFLTADATLVSPESPESEA